MDLDRAFDALVLSGVLLGCLAVTWLIFIGLARHLSGAPGRLLKTATNSVGALAALIYLFIGFAFAACDGNALYGYRSCRVIPGALANMSLPAFLIITVFGLGALLLITVAAVIWHWRQKKGLGHEDPER